MSYERHRETLQAAVAEMRRKLSGQSGSDGGDCGDGGGVRQDTQDALAEISLPDVLRLTADQLEESSPRMAGADAPMLLAVMNAMLASRPEDDQIAGGKPGFQIREEDADRVADWVSMFRVDAMLIFAIAAKQLAIRYDGDKRLVCAARDGC